MDSDSVVSLMSIVVVKDEGAGAGLGEEQSAGVVGWPKKGR